MKDLLTFLNDSPTAFQAVDSIVNELKEKGYVELDENEKFNIEKGGKYYVSRNGSSIIAFNVGKKADGAFMITASHTDCPSFKVKPIGTSFAGEFLKLNTEVYGGPLFRPWFDRPLSIAGRVMVKKNGNIELVSYNYAKPFCIIPSVCIHFDPTANKGKETNPAVDMQPLVSLKDNDFKAFLASDLGVNKEDVLGFDIFLYPCDKAIKWGTDDEFVSSFHIDNLECAYTSLCGFIDNFTDENINVYCCFDNEEVGSRTLQGAASDFLKNTLNRICDALDLDYYQMVSNGMLLSCDNAHSLHPNHPELSDPKNRPVMNKGVVIKQNANQSYTTDGLTLALFEEILNKAKVDYQVFTNRSDLRGGGTLGNISTSHVSIKSVDIGLAQLAMHSCYETAGSKDADSMIKAITAFYKTVIKVNKGGYTII